MSEVAEGINTARAVKKLADRANLEMPIVNEVNAVLYEGKSARDAVSELMSRPLREEAPSCQPQTYTDEHGPPNH